MLWSRLSVNSRYVKDEATYALKRNKLVPVAIEDVELPFRFDTLQTPRLVGWDGSTDYPEFQKLIGDIAQIVPPSTTKNQDQQPGAVFQDTLKDGSLGPEMVVVPAGEFQMGDIQGNGADAEKPVHRSYRETIRDRTVLNHLRRVPSIRVGNDPEIARRLGLGQRSPASNQRIVE